MSHTPLIGREVYEQIIPLPSKIFNKGKKFFRSGEFVRVKYDDLINEVEWLNNFPRPW